MRTSSGPNTHPYSASRSAKPDADSLALDRRRLCLGAASLFALAACTTAPRRAPARAGADVVPFSASRTLGELPDGWTEQVMRRDLPRTSYTVVERDGRWVVHAVSDGGASGLRCDVDVDPQATPWLDWSWRVDALDARASVAVDALDDAPARLMLAFDGDLARLTLRDQMFQEMVQAVTGYAVPFATLVYVWDVPAPPESVFRNPRSDRVRYLVVESGQGNTGHWTAYRRDVAADYRRVFGDEPGRITSVGIMTDSDDLKMQVQAWYGDIAFS